MKMVCLFVCLARRCSCMNCPLAEFTIGQKESEALRKNLNAMEDE